MAESKDYEHHFEEGRRFHSDKEGKYRLPNDIQEMDRLQMQHLIWAEMLDGRLNYAPLPESITAAADIGCGTGLWVLDFAAAHPDTQVTGTDLSPIQPKTPPTNVSFKIENAMKPWTFAPDSLDYIHTRAISLGITDWDHIISEAFKALKPGGWLELQEMTLPMGCDDETFTPDTAMWKWNQGLADASTKLGVDVRAAFAHEARMERLGLVNVDATEAKTPIGQWKEGEKWKRLGAIGEKDMGELFDGTAPLLMKVGWDRPGLDKLIPQAKEEIAETSVHVYMPLRLIWGQKPL